MKCICCDKFITDFEATRKYANTGEYLDMCNKCFHASELPSLIVVEEREDLLTVADIDEEECNED